MTIIIDRRPNPKGKSLPNRQRFIKRAKEHLKDAVRRKVANSKGVTDIINGDRKVEVDGKTLEEHTFRRDPNYGIRDYVLPGNKSFEPGDDIAKPESGGGGRGREAGDGSDFDESFIFTLTREEFIDILFDDLELPNLVKASLSGANTKLWQRSGITTSGSPVNLDLVRTMRNSLGRRIALKRPKQSEIDELEAYIKVAPQEMVPSLIEKLDALNRKKVWVPFIDPVDTRYRTFDERPKPITKAVMFCIMDVSGSMGEREKDLAKRFFMLLHLFLTTKYDAVDLVFIRHTTTADEVDERTFFYDRKSGGTEVLPALELMLKIQKERYDPSIWNLYCAQVSDGGIDHSDAKACSKLVRDAIAPLWQYFAYVEIGEDPAFLASIGGGIFTYTGGNGPMIPEYDSLGLDTVKTKKVNDPKDIFSVFRELFQRQIA